MTPQASRPKNQSINNRSNVVINSVKTLKMVHIKKILKKEPKGSTFLPKGDYAS